jgi:hypothetical protein
VRPRELLVDLPNAGAIDRRESLLRFRLQMAYLSDHVYQAELSNGMKVRDVTDVHVWLRELATEARISLQEDPGAGVSLRQELCASPRAAALPPQSRWREGSCPDCYHEHEGPETCGFYLGEGKFCKCPTKRAA